MLHLIEHHLGDAESPGRRYALQAHRDVDGVAVDVVGLDDPTSPMFSPKRNTILSGSGRLRLRVAMSCWISTAKTTASTALGNSARIPSPGRFDDPAGVDGDVRVDDIASQRHHADMGAVLVGVHEAGVADDVGREHRRQPAFGAQLSTVSPATPFGHSGRRGRRCKAERPSWHSRRLHRTCRPRRS